MSDDPPVPSSSRSAVVGFFLGAISWVLPFLYLDRYAREGEGFLWLGLVLFGLPLVAGILTLRKITRRFGLGLLLACGLGWLVLGVICGISSR